MRYGDGGKVRQPRMVALSLVCALILAGLTFGPATAAPPFTDVASGDPAATAINELAARGIIKGCDAAAGRFCPGDPTLRAQMAALIARAMQWDTEDHGTQFADRCAAVQGCIDNDLWRNIGTLQYYGVAKGYDSSSYGPHNNVAQQQVILFISRALVRKGIWQQQSDNGSVYPNLPRGNAAEQRDAQDVATYVAYVGAAPDTQAGVGWDGYAQPSTRAWFARALWQVLARFPVGPPPVTPPSVAALNIAPTAGPAGTTFTVTGNGVPVGATINWAFSYGGVAANTGSFVLTAGTTAFTFTATTDGSAAGQWSLTFQANGQALGTVFFTITSAPPSASAAQFKAAMTTALDTAYPPLAKVLNECPSSNPYYCDAIYNQAQTALYHVGDTLGSSLAVPLPVQCQALFWQLSNDLSGAESWMNSPYSNNSVAANSAFNAIKWLEQMKYRIVNAPGTCQ